MLEFASDFLHHQFTEFKLNVFFVIFTIWRSIVDETNFVIRRYALLLHRSYSYTSVKGFYSYWFFLKHHFEAVLEKTQKLQLSPWSPLKNKLPCKDCIIASVGIYADGGIDWSNLFAKTSKETQTSFFALRNSTNNEIFNCKQGFLNNQNKAIRLFGKSIDQQGHADFRSALFLDLPISRLLKISLLGFRQFFEEEYQHWLKLKIFLVNWQTFCPYDFNKQIAVSRHSVDKNQRQNGLFLVGDGGCGKWSNLQKSSERELKNFFCIRNFSQESWLLIYVHGSDFNTLLEVAFLCFSGTNHDTNLLPVKPEAFQQSVALEHHWIFVRLVPLQIALRWATKFRSSKKKRNILHFLFVLRTWRFLPNF